jgi:protein TonB
MKNLLLSIGFAGFMIISSYAQTTEKRTKEEPVFTFVEVQPEFPGGIEAMSKYLVENIAYPKDAKKANIQGKVYLKFVVDSKGNVRDAVIIKGVSESIDTEALRIVSAMPAWKPGTLGGKAVNVYYSLPLDFRLN